MERVPEKAKRGVTCPDCGARPGRACKGSRIPGANTLGGGWGGPPTLTRAHAARRDRVLAKRVKRALGLAGVKNVVVLVS